MQTGPCVNRATARVTCGKTGEDLAESGEWRFMAWRMLNILLSVLGIHPASHVGSVLSASRRKRLKTVARCLSSQVAHAALKGAESATPDSGTSASLSAAKPESVCAVAGFTVSVFTGERISSLAAMESGVSRPPGGMDRPSARMTDSETMFIALALPSLPLPAT